MEWDSATASIIKLNKLYTKSKFLIEYEEDVLLNCIHNVYTSLIHIYISYIDDYTLFI